VVPPPCNKHALGCKIRMATNPRISMTPRELPHTPHLVKAKPKSAATWQGGAHGLTELEINPVHPSPKEIQGNRDRMRCSELSDRYCAAHPMAKFWAHVRFPGPNLSYPATRLSTRTTSRIPASNTRRRSRKVFSHREFRTLSHEDQELRAWPMQRPPAPLWRGNRFRSPRLHRLSHAHTMPALIRQQQGLTANLGGPQRLYRQSPLTLHAPRR